MYHGAPCNEYYNPRMAVSDGIAEFLIDIKPDFFHAAQAVHGSVYFKALDDASFFAVSSLVKDVFVLTASFNLYLLRPVSAGQMRAVGRVVHRSRRLFIAEAELFDENEKILARGGGTFMKSEVILSAELGYK
jgi:uncharacterized protein (TIGR00369 family)